ncbi:hypothetical protein [Roseovarius litorisediminis]|uniref:hypothetical protein n=1 Tax=Roseovarius litorisediminis TaxID=1312363 RepID=UPI0015931A9C|nr:hypothetical protein [Roseovarius litorisediminis]
MLTAVTAAAAIVRKLNFILVFSLYVFGIRLIEMLSYGSTKTPEFLFCKKRMLPKRASGLSRIIIADPILANSKRAFGLGLSCQKETGVNRGMAGAAGQIKAGNFILY